MTCETVVRDRLVVERVTERATDVVIEEQVVQSVVVSEDGAVDLVEVLGETRITEIVRDTQVVEVGGLQGVPGPPGAAGGSSLSLIAGSALGGHRAVRSLAGVAVYADCETLADANLVLGITQGAASEGAAVLVQTMGLMTEPSWSWTPDLPVFVGLAGVLTQIPPAAGYRLIVGVATRADQIHIGLKMPIVLE